MQGPGSRSDWIVIGSVIIGYCVSSELDDAELKPRGRRSLPQLYYKPNSSNLVKCVQLCSQQARAQNKTKARSTPEKNLDALTSDVEVVGVMLLREMVVQCAMVLCNCEQYACQR